ncbi:biotin transporter BioY [Sedimentibacter sp. MB31-C6]|uniref:biotin transporter BioY n=1 Tax=Sedimentibacter sp. MB31-C6 TaxID=3109366 RepID=UPI002DDCCE84|nr:biotin transporter BioY [Sedimentibacter sp. MB36-C1]WSI04469.1 biotin transporter BioY [Sedimentibacter sp. MB36-C1]
MKLSINDITQTGIFTALTAIGAFISIPVGPVPITLQTFFVLLSGIILGSRKAMFSQIAYILLGLVGLPIFAGFSGGLQTITKPSFGFLIGSVLAAYCVGKITEKKSDSTTNMYIAVIIGTLIIYAIGIPYMYYILNIMLSSNLHINQILKLGMLMFIPGDTIKAIVTVLLGSKLQGKLNKRN